MMTFETKAEKRAVAALAAMANQYLTGRFGVLDSLSMGAGEMALEVLAQYGFVELHNGHLRSAEWTKLGEEFLRKN